MLNRQNTMIHFEREQSTIKNYFKEVSIKITSFHYQLFIKILNSSKKEISVEDLCSEVSSDKGHVLKVLKMLREVGSILIYPDDASLERYFSKGWFKVLLQYLPPSMDILNGCRALSDAHIYLTPEIDHRIPHLKDVLIKNDLDVSTGYNDLHNMWIVGSGHDNCSSIELLLEENRLVGMNHTLNPPKGRNVANTDGKDLDSNSLLYKIAPFYTMIYIIKSIAGISKSAFYMNRDGKFHEYNLTADEYTQTVKELSFPENSNHEDKLSCVGNFESFIINEPSIPISVSGWTDDVYSNIYQMGYSTYSLTATQDKQGTFVYAGTDYVETAFNAIKKGLAYFLNKESKQNDWLVTSSQSYYLDKTLFLLGYTSEPYMVNKVKKTQGLWEIVKYLEFLDMDLDFYVKKHNKTNSFIVYIHDKQSDDIYTDGKRTVDVQRKIFVLVLNYMLVTSNADTKLANVLEKVDNREIREELLNDSVREAVLSDPVDETEFIENCLDFFEQVNIDYFESAWIYETQLNKANLIIRKMEVETD